MIQYSFKKHYFRKYLSLHLSDKITTEFERGLLTEMSLIDLEIPFDTIVV